MNDDIYDDIFGDASHTMNGEIDGGGEVPLVVQSLSQDDDYFRSKLREAAGEDGGGGEGGEGDGGSGGGASGPVSPVSPKGGKTWLKIVVPVLIIAVVVAIWIFKNAGANDDALSAVQPTNPDFALNVTGELDVEKLKTYGLPIIIDFGADWCAPCKAMAPILVKLNGELQGKAIIKFVDVDKFPEIAGEYPVSVIPTQVFYDSTGNPFYPAVPEQYQLILYSFKDGGAHALTAHEGGLTEEMMLGMLAEMGMK